MIKQTQTGNVEMDFDTFSAIVKLVAHATEKPTSNSVYCEADDLQAVRDKMEQGGYGIDAITKYYHRSLKIARLTRQISEHVNYRDGLIVCVEANECVCGNAYEMMKSMDSHNGRIEHYNNLITKATAQIKKIQRLR